jgi:hypothetical protein
MISDCDKLLAQRNKIHKAIQSLELGFVSERKKLEQNEFFLKHGGVLPEHAAAGITEYDKPALQVQIDQSRVNLELIGETLAAERAKHERIEQHLAHAYSILEAHETSPCLLGSAPHTWLVLKGKIDSHFERKCSVCGTVQKVGSP